MNWNHYLLEKKSPSPPWAHLGVIDGLVSGIFDLSQIPKGTKALSLCMPLKKFKLSYTNWEILIGNIEIEAIELNEVTEWHISLLSTLPNLKYLQISVNKQEDIPDLSSLTSLEVLILASIKKAKDINFLSKLKNLKTLYICDFNNLYDLSPISYLKKLEELSLSNGGMSGVGRPVNSMKPLASLTELEYLSFSLTVEGKNYDITPIFSLKKLKYLEMLPRYYKKGQLEILKNKFPNTEIL